MSKPPLRPKGAPSRKAILKLLSQHEASLPPCDDPPLPPTLAEVMHMNAMKGIASGRFVLINRNLLRILIKELSQ
jgi:hypothetical protein